MKEIGKYIFSKVLAKRTACLGKVLVVMEVDKTKKFKDHVENNDWFEVLAWFKHKLHLL